MDKGKWLIIAEKPSVANDLAKTLGKFEKKQDYFESDNYIITWAIGHLLELISPEEVNPIYKRWLLQDLPILPEKFQFKPKLGQTERLNKIKSLSKRKEVSGFINACDAGREGELIFREIFDYCQVEKPIKRLWLQSMTSDAIMLQFSRLKDGKEFDFLGDAARCRAESDWLIGMNGTRAITKRLKAKSAKDVWSVGRVQTPTLALLVEREITCLKHRPVPYWTLEARFKHTTHEYSAYWFDPDFKKTSPHLDDEDLQQSGEKEDRIFSENKLKEILLDFNNNLKKAIAKETRKESKEIPPQLFDLTQLQREANRKFGMSAARTLQSAQRLYEKHKVITYPRTDSKYLPEDFVTKVNDVISSFKKHKTYGEFCSKLQKQGLLNQHRVFNDKYITDHFAIIPTGELSGTLKLEGDDSKIFDLVMKRFLAAFYPHAVWDKVERITRVGEQKFRTRVQDLRLAGWREVYGLDTEEESQLPPLSSGSEIETPVETLEANSQENKTKPLPRLNEARLLSLMEHCGKTVEDEEIAAVMFGKGIGTPATRAEIIENLLAKDYAVRNGKFIRATSKGIRLVDALERIPIEQLSKVDLTGQIEFELKQVELGKLKRSDFMKNMSDFTRNMVDKARTFAFEEIYHQDGALGKCPSCRQGEVWEGFWGYQCNYEPCRLMIWKEKNQRYVDRSVVQEIVEKNLAGPLEFINASGVSYETFLKIHTLQTGEKKLIFCSDTGEPLEGQDSSIEPLHEEMMQETFLQKPGVIKDFGSHYFCEYVTEAAAILPESENASAIPKKTRSKKKTETETKKPKKVKKEKKLTARMPKVLCGHPVTLDEFKFFISTGQTPPIVDFKSKKGRTFAAALHQKPNGSFEFKFISKKALAGESGEEGASKTKVVRKTKKSSRAKVKKA